MNQSKEVVILSVPYCEPLPMVAPVLLAGCLEAAGISAKAIDFNIHFLQHLNGHRYQTEFKNFLTIGNVVRSRFDKAFFKNVLAFTKKFLDQIIKVHNPQYIGLSIFTSESLDFGLVMSYLLRKYHPEIRILAGGKGLEVFAPSGRKHAEIWVDNAIADTVVTGDAESSIIDVVKNNRTGLYASPRQTKEDLDKIPLAQWDDYDLSVYSSLSGLLDRQEKTLEPYLTISSSKGCVRNCTFCDVDSFWPDFIYRDPVKVAEEIIHNYRATGINQFVFTDNLINGSVSNFRIMNETILRNLADKEINYSGYAIFRGKHQMPEKDFELAARAGNLAWYVGVESGSEKVRYDMKKKFDNDDLDWSVQMLFKYGIQQNWLLMVGYPTETEVDFQETKNMLRRYQPLIRLNNDAIKIQVTPTFMVLKNSPLITNPTLSLEYGLSHIKNEESITNKFWTSTKFIDNDYPTRSRRWKELITLSQELGYGFGHAHPVQKFWDEILHLDKLYDEQKTKIFPISAV